MLLKSYKGYRQLYNLYRRHTDVWCYFDKFWKLEKSVRKLSTSDYLRTNPDLIKKAAISSNAIEGVSDKHIISGTARALGEADDLFDTLSVTPSTLCYLHKLMLNRHLSDAGSFRKGEVTIVASYPDGRTLERFKPIKADLVDSEMAYLLSDIDPGGFHIEPLDGMPTNRDITTIPLIIFDFLCIHPFSDGNGRISRILTTWLLLRAGYDITRAMNLDAWILENQKEYYDVLQASQIGWHSGDYNPKPWMDFFYSMISEAYAAVSWHETELKTHKRG